MIRAEGTLQSGPGLGPSLPTIALPFESEVRSSLTAAAAKIIPLRSAEVVQQDAPICCLIARTRNRDSKGLGRAVRELGSATLLASFPDQLPTPRICLLNCE
ncbi:hypothetical protein NDU88_001502 [Pleurodeles waltl]|uniref:Uncharacterized protein n=1 Tax=Pleurodeles waltl TaxID=8319 RepID=A0AAV7P5Q1_PLEWA|nr:hypothetical protein NDU88_001502 [Pleurodeles waltl]